MDETTQLLRLIERMGVRQQESQKRLEARLKEVKEEIEKDVDSVKQLTKVKDCVNKCKKSRFFFYSTKLHLAISSYFLYFHF